MKVFCVLFVCATIGAVVGVNEDSSPFGKGQPVGDRNGPVTFGNTETTRDPSFGGGRRDPTAEPEPEPGHGQDHTMKDHMSPSFGSNNDGSSMGRKEFTDHSMHDDHSTMTGHDGQFGDSFRNSTTTGHDDHFSSSSVDNKHLSSDPFNHDHSFMNEKNMTSTMSTTTERMSPHVPKASKQGHGSGAESLGAIPALLTTVFVSLRMMNV